MADILLQMRKDPVGALGHIKPTNPILREVFLAIPEPERRGVVMPDRGHLLKQWLMDFAKGSAGGGGGGAGAGASAAPEEPQSAPMTARGAYSDPPQQQQPRVQPQQYQAPPPQQQQQQQQYQDEPDDRYMQPAMPQRAQASTYANQPPQQQQFQQPPQQQQYQQQPQQPQYQPPQQQYQQPQYQPEPQYQQQQYQQPPPPQQQYQQQPPRQQQQQPSFPQPNFDDAHEHESSSGAPSANCLNCRKKDLVIKKLTALVQNLMDQIEDNVMEARGDLTLITSAAAPS